jgi:hypothetical protein
VLACAACDPPPPEPLPPDSFAFGVYGDGPYEPWEQGRWRRVLADVASTDVAWLIHLGDLFWYPCSDEMYARRARELAAVPHPVVYTPGDNEWSDCWQSRPGGWDPLDRLAELRGAFFSQPGVSTGTPRMTLETQAADTAFAEFPENVRWRRGGFVFATLHLVGGGNAMAPFPARTPASDEESTRRMQAVLDWTRATFDTARATGANGVVLVFHAEIGLDLSENPRGRDGYQTFIAEMERQTAGFPGEVIAIHGDSHHYRVDHPLADSAGRTYERFTRIETYGSPDIGWLRIALDTVAGKVARVEGRRFRGWW